MTEQNPITLPRVFKVGTVKLEDPCPGQPLANAVRVLSKSYPQFRQSRLYEEDGVVGEDEIVYELKIPPAKVNG